MSRKEFEFGSSKIEELSYWMNERHRIYLRRQSGEPAPWTEDPVLRSFRFTNVFRELDKGTIALREMLGEVSDDPRAVIFNTIWYRMFNRYEHATDVGLCETPDELRAKIREVERSGKRMFTAAHMTVGRAGEAKQDTVCATMDQVFARMDELVALCLTARLETMFKLLRAMRFYGIGGFIAYEIVSDLRWYPFLYGPNVEPIDTLWWANVGPGCRRGLLRLGYVEQTPAEIRDVFTRVVPSLEDHVLNFRLPVEMREIEHSLCEFDKYARGGSKQRYHA